MTISKEQRDLILSEIKKLDDAGVKINVVSNFDGGDKKESGYAKIQGRNVFLLIHERDPIDLTISNIVEAGELVNEALSIKEHEENHPNLFTALINRGYGRY